MHDNKQDTNTQKSVVKPVLSGRIKVSALMEALQPAAGKTAR